MSEPFSSEKIQDRTGKSWETWYQLLDDAGAAAWGHAEIARWVAEEHQISGWYAQSVTIAYERARGLRALGGDRDGTFNASVSKTFPVPVTVLFNAWVDEAQRNQWLGVDVVRFRTASPPKSARFDVPETATILPVYFSDKGENKSSVQVEETGLADANAVAMRKDVWRTRFGALSEFLKKM